MLISILTTVLRMSEYTAPLSALKLSNPLTNPSKLLNLDAGNRPISAAASIPRPSAVAMEQGLLPSSDRQEFNEFSSSEYPSGAQSNTPSPPTGHIPTDSTLSPECKEVGTSKVKKMKKSNKHSTRNKKRLSLSNHSKKSASASANIPARGWTPVPSVDHGCEREIVSIKVPWNDSLSESEQVALIKQTYFGKNADRFTYKGMVDKDRLLDVAEKLIDCLERIM